MNARVLLLMLVTALFMGAWNGDQAVLQSALAKRNLQKQSVMAARTKGRQTQEAEPVQVQTASQEHRIAQQKIPVRTVSISPTTVTALTSGASDAVGPDEPLIVPKTIPPGCYQAVSQRGELKQVTVTRKKSTHVERDLYVLDAESGERWYLIRLK